jgi:8-oxo-dGTP pyrophosphatase MutT (NUDIX family)
VSAPGPEIKLSATILLLRDSQGSLEVFMVERHHQIDFATGALVFPGGKVEEADDGATMRKHCRGVDGLDDAAVTARVAAIRETFEEAGVLLARPLGEAELVTASTLEGIETRHREALQAGNKSLLEVIDAEGLELACDLLVHFAHWVTPEAMPKRFDTHFFLAAAPPDQLALHDGGEAVDSIWTRVDDAVAREAAGECTIIFPTLTNLRKLGRSSSVQAALDAARSSDIVTVLPWVRKDEAGEAKLCIPAEADYDITETPISALKGA